MAASAPSRRDAAGVDKTADLGEFLRRNPLLNGALVVTAIGDGVSGSAEVTTFAHPLGRPYTGAFPVGADGPDAFLVAHIQPQAFHPKQAARDGVDVTRLVKVAYIGAGTDIPVTWWVF